MQRRKLLFLIIVLSLSLVLVLGCNSESQESPQGAEGLDQEKLDEALSLAIKGQASSYAEGETVTEGHIILEIEEKAEEIKVYTIASFGAFGFENGIFTKISGSGAIPTVITFTKEADGEYSLKEYQEPLDGADYGASLKRLFPENLHERIFEAHEDYKFLAEQQEMQATEYLNSIGRTAEIRAGHVEKELAQINVEASNMLFSYHTKYDAFLNACPYWLGTREKVEDSVRYIYETSQSKTDDGYDLIIFRKMQEDGTIVEEEKYKIVGSEPQLIE